MLQCKTIYPNKTSLSFRDRSIYGLMVVKMLLLLLNFKAWEEHFTIWLSWATLRRFSHILPLPYFSSEWFSIFCFLLCAKCWLCYCGWITKFEGSISRPYLLGNHQRCHLFNSALIFGWMGNGINKKPIIIYIDLKSPFLNDA